MPAVRDSELIVRHELSGDVCCPVAVVVVTSDGRAVRRADDGQLFERKLSTLGVERLRDRVLGTGLFDHDQGFSLELLPGATPPAHGIGGLLFRVWAGQTTVTVTSAPLQGDEESRYYRPSPARTRLDALSMELREMEAWLPASAWADTAPRPYIASHFALFVRRQPGPSGAPSTVEALARAWPFSAKPEDLGQPLQPSAGSFFESTRCAVLAPDDLTGVREAIVRAGATFEPTPDGQFYAIFSMTDRNEELAIAARPLLPDRSSCAGEYAF